MKKILLLNGPPRSGKDTIAEWLETRGWYHGKFSKVLKERCHDLYGMTGEAHDAFEEEKDTVLPEFYGVSPRDAYINLSEDLMKPRHGEDIWVRMFVDELKNVSNDYIVVSDLGFQVEYETLMKLFGYKKISLGMIYRAGCDFSKDSRDYVHPRGPWDYGFEPDDNFSKYIQNNCFEIENGAGLPELLVQALNIEKSIKRNLELVITGNGPSIGSVANSKAV